MRYCIIPKTLSVQSIYEHLVKISGVRDIVMYHKVKMLFVTVDDGSVLEQVRTIGGCRVEPVKAVKTPDSLIPSAVTPPTPKPGVARFTPQEEEEISGIDILKGLTEPPLSGEGVTVAVVDSGILETHELVNRRVVYSETFVGGVADDRITFNDGSKGHGTGVAGIIVQLAPDVNIVNMKVVSDSGSGTNEQLIAAINKIVKMIDEDSEYAPDIVNMSLAVENDIDKNGPVAIAVKQLLYRGIPVVAAAGNYGPDDNTITVPALVDYVVAVGSCNIDTLRVSYFSSRGNPNGVPLKPDCCQFGEDIIVADTSSNFAVRASSGTSYATPIVTAIFTLWKQLFNVVSTELQGVEDPTEYTTPELTPENIIDNILDHACGKPEGSVMVKDNSYGYGILLGSLIVESLRKTIGYSSSNIDDMLTSIMPVMMMGMMIGVMGQMMQRK